LRTAPFLRAAFFAPGRSFVSFAFIARTTAQRRFVAAMIALRPAADSFRFGFALSNVTSDDDLVPPLIVAHRFCWPRVIRRRAAAETFRRVLVGASAVTAVPAPLP
jgi:hypothetical protein